MRVKVAIQDSKKFSRFNTLVAFATMVLMFLLWSSNSLASEETKTANGAIIHTVEIQQFKFVPEQLTIKNGDSIRWVNRDFVPHTATAIDKSWDTGELKKNESKILVFTKDSISEYYCFYHPMMKATFKINIE